MCITRIGSVAAFAITRGVLASVLELFPSFSRLKLMRQWAGAVDITPDTSPIMASPRYAIFTSTAVGARVATRPYRQAETQWRKPWWRISRIR